MGDYLDVLSKSIIFNGIDKNEINVLLKCLLAVEKKLKKGEYIFHQGDFIKSIFIVVEGKVHITKEDYWGNHSIISEASVGEIFGEVYACVGNLPAQVNAMAIKDCFIIEMNISKILKHCSASCGFHQKLIENLLNVVAEKNLILNNKLDCVSQRSIRDKIMRYLSQQSVRARKNEFEIPFNRQQMADFLAVDRSAMSKELCKLRDEGVIEFNKNHFKLL